MEIFKDVFKETYGLPLMIVCCWYVLEIMLKRIADISFSISKSLKLNTFSYLLVYCYFISNNKCDYKCSVAKYF